MECEAIGKTVDEAIGKALNSLGIKKENAVVEIKNEPTQGLLGIIGSKQARVLVKPLYSPAVYLETYLRELLGLVKIACKVNICEDEEKVEAQVFGKGVGILIGRRGRTLSDMQYLLNVVMRRQYTAFNKKIVLDVENYRARRERVLTVLAKNMARKAIEEGREQVLEPMSPQERRVIHLVLQDEKEVVTFSTGDEPHRKVVIAPR